MSYLHDSALTKLFVVKITVERCDEILVAVPQIFDRVKSVALWSAKKRKKDHKGLQFRSYYKPIKCRDTHNNIHVITDPFKCINDHTLRSDTEFRRT
jgi:hypothetical protein